MLRGCEFVYYDDLTAFSVSVRLCYAGVKGCLRGCRQAEKARQLIR